MKRTILDELFRDNMVLTEKIAEAKDIEYMGTDPLKDAKKLHK